MLENTQYSCKASNYSTHNLCIVVVEYQLIYAHLAPQCYVRMYVCMHIIIWMHMFESFQAIAYTLCVQHTYLAFSFSRDSCISVDPEWSWLISLLAKVFTPSSLILSTDNSCMINNTMLSAVELKIMCKPFSITFMYIAKQKVLFGRTKFTTSDVPRTVPKVRWLH